METLQVLEQRVKSLISLVQNLKELVLSLQEQNKALQEDQAFNHEQLNELKKENSTLTEENAQLLLQVEAWQTSSVKQTENVEELVDDLIKSIDFFVENENQQ